MRLRDAYDLSESARIEGLAELAGCSMARTDTQQSKRFRNDKIGGINRPSILAELIPCTKRLQVARISLIEGAGESARINENSHGSFFGAP